MKNFIAIVVSAYSICGFLSAPVEANENPVFVEKGSKSKSKSKSKIIVTGSCCGVPGPCGPCGAPGPKGGCSSVYATLIQDEVYPTQEWIDDLVVTVPLNQQQVAKGTTLDAVNNSFTLPKGVYSIHFQFSMEPRRSETDDLQLFDIFLAVNNEGKRVPLDWTVALYGGGDFAPDPFACYYGSRIFSLATDSVVKLQMARWSGYDIKFSFPDDGLTPGSPHNNPVSITIEKIDEV